MLLLRAISNSQDYECHRNTLAELLDKNGSEIVQAVDNKVSGTKKNESEKS